MVHYRMQGLSVLLAWVQVGLLALAFWVSVGAACLLGRADDFTGSWMVGSFLAVTVLFLVVSRLLWEGPAEVLFYSERRQRQLAGLTCLALLIPMGVYSLAKPFAGGMYWFLLFYVVASYAVLRVNFGWLPAAMARMAWLSRSPETTLLVGDVKMARRLLPWLRRRSPLGVQVTGVLTPDGIGDFGDVPCLGSYADLAERLASQDVRQVILLGAMAFGEDLSRVAAIVERCGCRLLVMNDFSRLLGQRVTVVSDGPFTFMTIRTEPLESPSARVIKRIFDLVIAWAVLLTVLPVVAALVKLFQVFQSPGPLFYKQKRSGLHNEPFVMFKFRTMHTGSFDEAKQASRNDQRIYPFGAWLRRLSLDELPQFINVIRGEMSVVGPRPHLSQHDAIFAEQMKSYPQRMIVKPGITGLAQIRGFRGETRGVDDIRHRVEADLLYIERWRFSLDVYIVMKTVWQMLRPPSSAY